MKREFDNVFLKKVVALAMKILPIVKKQNYFEKSVDFELTLWYYI